VKVFFSLLAFACVLGGTAYARDTEDCQTKWGGAVRSYLMQNRNTHDDKYWEGVFKPACDIEKSDKAKARVEAVVIAAQELVKIDPRGCARFLDSYVGAQMPEKICEAASGGDAAALRKMIESNLPPPPAGKKKG
jgi:hypothetical protein